MTDHQAEKMRRHWDGFAADDAMFYITGWRKDWTVEDFLQSGRHIVDSVMAWIDDEGARGHMLDIGCGLGRLSVAFGAHYEQVDGIDISEAMIKQAREMGPPANVRFSVGSGSDLDGFDDESLDMAFCFVVFQHVPDDEVIASYLSDIRRTLKPSGQAVVQFDTRPAAGALSALYRLLPDVLLPATQRRFIRRYRRTPERVAQLIADAGLRVQRERGEGTDQHLVLARKPS